jgi:transposase
VRRHLAPHALVQRSRMVLMLADGLGPTEIGRLLGVSDRVVRKWRTRWEKAPVAESLRDADRPGRPISISLETRCRLVQLACARPEDVRGVRHPVWTQRALTKALYAQSGMSISRSSVQRILSSKGLRPHRVRYWLHSPDPDFAKKVRRICRLYLKPPPDAVVVCIDEKPMQALGRRASDRRSRNASVRHEFEYVRRGVCHLLGAFDVRTGRVLGSVVNKRSAGAVHNFLEVVARAFPERRVFVVWDNLNIHHDGNDGRWTEFSRHHGGRFIFVYTPLHASWVNQIEVWFSILQRRLLRYGTFESVADLRAQVLAFIRYWNRFEAHPFNWKFSGKFVQPTPVALAA